MLVLCYQQTTLVGRELNNGKKDIWTDDMQPMNAKVLAFFDIEQTDTNVLIQLIICFS